MEKVTFKLPNAADNNSPEQTNRYMQPQRTQLKQTPTQQLEMNQLDPTNLSSLTLAQNCGPSWSLEQLQATIEWGAHPSAKTPEAIKCLRKETLEKVQQGSAKLIPWSEREANPPTNLKLSPLAAVPHQSQPYRAILDFSFEIQVGGIPLPSINAATVIQSQPEAMKQSGNATPRLIAAIAAMSPRKGPLLFTKWDINDGF